MADKKITELVQIDTIASGDVFPIVDISDNITKKIDITQIKAQSPVQSVNSNIGVVVLTKTDIGLSNVDNTSDANKPVSTAQQTALNLKVPYTGATGDVDLGVYISNAASFHAKGTAGAGHLGLKHQSSGSTASGSESVIYADSVGNPKWKNDGNSVQNVMLENAAITGATKTKITYDAKGLVTSGADATTADIADSSNKRYVTDAQLTVIGNTSGTNSGNQTLANTSDATSHTTTLSATGGSVKLVEGSGITLTTTGTSADGIITIASTGGGSGTVTDVAALTLGTTGTDLSSSVANGTTTPVITLNVPTASATNRGALSSANWSTFNGKQDALVSGTSIKTVNSTSLLGSGDVAVQATLVSGTNIKTVNSTSLLGSGDIAVQATITGAATTITTSDLTVSRALVSNASGKVAVATTTSTEIGYVNGVTSAIQTQIDTKSAKLITTNRQTASYTLVIGDADKLVEMNVGSANNLTIPLNSSVAFATGTQILLAQYGAGQTTIVPTSGVTIRSNGAKVKLNAQYSGATLIKIDTNEWYLFGDIA
jgi:hypothetical protein